MQWDLKPLFFVLDSRRVFGWDPQHLKTHLKSRFCAILKEEKWYDLGFQDPAYLELIAVLRIDA